MPNSPKICSWNAMATVMMTDVRGASNEKAKRELGWKPRYASWRQGFAQGLG